MSFSNYLEDSLLDHIFDDPAYSPPANVFIALYTATPNDAGGGTEVSGGSYARQSTAAADWNAASSGSKDNANAITFPEATAGWGTVTSFGLRDAVSGGNLLAYGDLTASKTINSGDTLKFNEGNLTVSLD